MRDPNRINGVIETVRRVWHLVPDWRLGQLICNLSRECGSWDSFYTEDDLLDAAARSWLLQHENRHGDVSAIVINRNNYRGKENNYDDEEEGKINAKKIKKKKEKPS